MRNEPHNATNARISDSRVSRRRFLAAAASAGVAAPYFVPRTVLAAPGRRGANERVHVGVIGTGNRVTWLVNNWCDPGEMRIVALADCSAAKMDAFIDGYTDSVDKIQVPGVKQRFPEVATCNRYEDYREMLDKEKLDGVFVTTPTHGRVLPCIHACQAGVDIYAEKPVTLTIEEGQLLVQAVRKYNRVFQSGTQARSIAINCWAVEQLKRGAIGAVTKVRVPNFVGPIDYQPLTESQPAPAGMNWNLWCNQAPLVPYDPKLAARLEAGWALYRAYDGGGEHWGMTGYGTHAFDQVLWALGRELESPVAAWPVKPGDAMSPVSFRFADGLEIEMMEEPAQGPAFGGIFIGKSGKMEINRERVATNPPDIADRLPKFDSPDEGRATHPQNWIDSIRSRGATRCPVEVAHRQTVIAHIANVTRDLGREVHYDPVADRFVGDAEANRHPSVTRDRREGFRLPETI